MTRQERIRIANRLYQNGWSLTPEGMFTHPLAYTPRSFDDAAETLPDDTEAADKLKAAAPDLLEACEHALCIIIPGPATRLQIAKLEAAIALATT